MSDSQSNIVIDNGSSSIKCGFSGEEAPKSIFSNIISLSTDKVGDESLEDNISPIEHGIITNFDLMEKNMGAHFHSGIKGASRRKKYFNE